MTTTSLSVQVYVMLCCYKQSHVISLKVFAHFMCQFMNVVCNSLLKALQSS